MLLLAVTFISAFTANQSAPKSDNQVPQEIDEILSEDEILSQKRDKINSDSIEIDISEIELSLDSLSGAPALFTWFNDESVFNLSGATLILKPVELTNMYTGEKYYRLIIKADPYSGNSIIGYLLIEDAVSLINAFIKINEYVNKSLYENSEEILYRKDIDLDRAIIMWLDYNEESYNWKGSLSIVSNSLGVGCEIKDVIEDLPKLIKFLEDGVKNLTLRMYNGDTTKKLMKRHQPNGDVLYYWDGNTQYDSIPITDIEYIDKRYFYGEKYIEKKNKDLNKIIEKNNPSIKTLGKYGYIDIVWNPEGKVVQFKIMLTKEVSKKISERTIKIMLNKIREFKIKKYQTTKDEDCEHTRAAIPLEMEE